MDAVLNWLWQGGVVAVALGLMLFSLDAHRPTCDPWCAGPPRCS